MIWVRRRSHETLLTKLIQVFNNIFSKNITDKYIQVFQRFESSVGHSENTYA